MTKHFILYLVIRTLETVVENIQNVGELSLKCANAFQVLRHLQLKAEEVTLTLYLEFLEIQPPQQPSFEHPWLEAPSDFPAALLHWQAQGPGRISHNQSVKTSCLADLVVHNTG